MSHHQDDSAKTDRDPSREAPRLRPRPQPPNWPLQCQQHLLEPAIALCTTCAITLCRECRVVAPDGRAHCANCYTTEVGVRTGRRPAAPRPRFLPLLRDVLLRPLDMAKGLTFDGTAGPVFWWGLACSVVGQLAMLFWLATLQGEWFAAVLSQIAEEAETTVEDTQVLLLTMLPMLKLFQMVMGALMLQIGILLTGVRTRLRYRDFLKIVGYASLAHVLLAIPTLGPILGILYSVLFCWHAVRHHHQLTTIQTMLAVSPMMVLFMVMMPPGG